MKDKRKSIRLGNKIVKVDHSLHNSLSKMKRGNESICDVIFSLVGNRREDVSCLSSFVSTGAPLNVYNVDTPGRDVYNVDIYIGIIAFLGVLGFLTTFLILRKK